MVRRMAWLGCAGLVLLGGMVTAAPQQSPGSAVPELTVDVWVRDRQGTARSGLSARDFGVQLDGQEQRVRSARFIGEAADAADRARPANDGPHADLPRRSVAVVVDDVSLEGNEPGALVEAAGRWMARLPASDRVAIFRPSDPPAARPTVQPPSDATARLTRPAPDSSSSDRSEPDAFFAQEHHTLRQVEAIAKAVSWLATESGPRVLVVLSAGMVMPPDAILYLSPIATLARQNGIETFLVAPGSAPAPADPAAVPRASWDSAPVDDPAQRLAGLEQIASSFRTRLLHAADSPAGVFDTIGRALAGFYRLVVDVPSGVVLPRSLPAAVSVRASDLVVSSASRLSPPAGLTTPRTSEERQRDILAGVDAASEIDIDVSTALALDPASADRLQLMVGLTVPRAVTPPVRAWVGVLDGSGNVRVGATEMVGAAGAQRTSLSIDLEPGWHRVTVLVGDAEGRLGSVALPVLGRLRSLAGYILAEPRLLWRADASGWEMLAGGNLPEEAVAAAAIYELYAEPDRRPPALTLHLEDESGRELASQALTPTLTDQGWRFSSEIRPAGLEPGAYAFRLDTTPLSPGASPLVVRFRKTTAADPSAAAAARPALPDVADLLNLFRAAVRDDWPRFTADDLLVPDLLTPQLQALAGSRGLPAALTSASGEAWWKTLRSVGSPGTALGLAARGLAALHDGDARTAEAQLRDAASAGPASPVARRLLGLAHAAAGRDDAAAGVWSLGAMEKAGDERWTVAYAEALGRAGDFAAALQVLRGIPEPRSTPTTHRLIDALVIVGQLDEATTLLRAWEASGGAEQPASRLAFYLVALRYAAVIESGADGAALDEFRRTAGRYVAADGEFADMVGTWIQSTAGLGN